MSKTKILSHDGGVLLHLMIAIATLGTLKTATGSIIHSHIWSRKMFKHRKRWLRWKKEKSKICIYEERKEENEHKTVFEVNAKTIM
jgi:hypothetical protein